MKLDMLCKLFEAPFVISTAATALVPKDGFASMQTMLDTVDFFFGKLRSNSGLIKMFCSCSYTSLLRSYSVK